MELLIKRTKNPFPSDLEGRLNAVMNIANGELKVATLLHLDDTLAGGEDILARVRESVGRGVRLIYGNNFSGYCHKSLLPIGTVAEEEIRRDDGEVISVGYRITEAGKKYGVPISVFSLQWGVDNGVSLYSVLGSTCSKGKTRSPLNRIKILKALRERGILREIDLYEVTGLDNPSLSEHLESLKKIDFVEYSSVPGAHERKGVIKYRHTGKQGEPKPVRGRIKLPRKVLELMTQLETANCYVVADRLGHSPSNCSSTLSVLERQGFLERIGFFEGRRIKSRAEIKDRGRKFVDEYIEFVEAALTDDSMLDLLAENAQRFLRDSEIAGNYLVNGIKNYWKFSPWGNAKPKEETNLRIIDYVQRNPGARPRDIGRDLGLTSPTTYLTPLIKAGKLEKRKIDEQNKAAVGYFVKDN